MTYIKRFRLASSTCRFTSFMKSVESLALFILWCLCTIPCIEKQARGAHISKSDFFFDFYDGSAWGCLTEKQKRALDFVLCEHLVQSNIVK